MNRQVAIFFFGFLCLHGLVSAYSLDVNTSFESFRGMPDGSWNGNNGATIGVNGALSVYDCANVQLGGSYGVFDWDGRGNLVFANPKKTEQIGFLTVGASTSYCNWTGGLVYDRLFTSNFGIYCLDPAIGQLRFQLGYFLDCCDEVGVWGTYGLCTAKEFALGIPTRFRAIGQMNFFWRHQFDCCAETTCWIGMPYQDSLMFPDERAGNLILGFSFRVPLMEQLCLDGNGSYMQARKSPGVVQSRNYGFNVSVGLTYCFNGCERCYDSPYMSLANHSNFFVDTDFNQ